MLGLSAYVSANSSVATRPVSTSIHRRLAETRMITQQIIMMDVLMERT
jgi:hypothetical protein